MIIKSDFVTNSSSTAYIILDLGSKPMDFATILWQEGLERWQMEVNEVFTKDQINEFKKFNNYKEELDWVKNVTGPNDGSGILSSLAYNTALTHLHEGHTIHYIVIDKNYDIYKLVEKVPQLQIIYIDGGY